MHDFLVIKFGFRFLGIYFSQVCHSNPSNTKAIFPNTNDKYLIGSVVFIFLILTQHGFAETIVSSEKDNF